MYSDLQTKFMLHFLFELLNSNTRSNYQYNQKTITRICETNLKTKSWHDSWSYTCTKLQLHTQKSTKSNSYNKTPATASRWAILPLRDCSCCVSVLVSSQQAPQSWLHRSTCFGCDWSCGDDRGCGCCVLGEMEMVTCCGTAACEGTGSCVGGSHHRKVAPWVLGLICLSASAH